MGTEEDALETQQLEVEQLNELLWNDVQFYLSNNDASERNCRTTIRAVYAWLDGVLAALTAALLTHKLVVDPTTLSDPELDLLLDFHKIPTYGERRKRLTFDDSVVRALNVLAGACNTKFHLNQHPEWELFQTCTRIRNRITHPKCPADLAVRKEEVEGVIDAVVWLQKVISDIQNADTESIKNPSGIDISTKWRRTLRVGIFKLPVVG